MEFPIQQGGGISNSEPSTSAPENDYRQFYEIIDNREQVIEKFYGTRQRMTISVHSLEHCPNPEAVLLHIFQEAIDIARSRARASGLNPETVGANVISAALDYDMWTPIRRYNEDTAASILHRFECMNTYKENRLIQAPFDVEITCFDTKRLEQHAAQHPQPPIEGHGRKRKNFEVFHNAYEQGMIRICNTDTFCLFHALETARMDATETNRKKFTNYRSSANRQYKSVRDMMIEAGIPRNLTKYDATIYLPIVQEYYEQKYPGNFRIYLFNKAGQYRPAMMTGSKDNATPLCIYHRGMEFHTISNIRTFFGVEEYCFSCLMPYDRKSNHTSKCGALCLNCRRVGKKLERTISVKLMVRLKLRALDAIKYLKMRDVTWRILQTEYAQNLSAANAASSGIRR